LKSLFSIIKEGGIVKKVWSFVLRLSFKYGGMASRRPAHIKIFQI